MIAKNAELQEALYAKQEEARRLQEAMYVKQEEANRLQEQVIHNQEEMKQMQQQALGQLAVLQSRVQAVLTQTYELHEYPIPRLFVVLPQDPSGWDSVNILQIPTLLFVRVRRTHKVDQQQKQNPSSHSPRKA